MTGHTTHSQPVYPPLAWDTSGRDHLVWMAEPHTAWLAALGPCPGELEVIDSDDPALARLQAQLARARMGLRLYLIGDEDTLWRASRLAAAAGLGEAEIRRHHAGTLARPVWCVHCQHTQRSVHTNLLTCAGCGRTLFVRDHFSRRLGAYMGFQIDAEVPGVCPPVETLYP